MDIIARALKRSGINNKYYLYIMSEEQRNTAIKEHITMGKNRRDMARIWK